MENNTVYDLVAQLEHVRDQLKARLDANPDDTYINSEGEEVAYGWKIRDHQAIYDLQQIIDTYY